MNKKKKDKIEVRYIGYGTGNRIGNIIYLNKDLKKYPKLHAAILKHEKNHSGNFRFNDFKLDFVNNEIKQCKKEFYKFIIKHPKALLNFLPIMKIEGKFYFDPNISILWGVIIFELYMIFRVLVFLI